MIKLGEMRQKHNFTCYKDLRFADLMFVFKNDIVLTIGCVVVQKVSHVNFLALVRSIS